MIGAATPAPVSRGRVKREDVPDEIAAEASSGGLFETSEEESTEDVREDRRGRKLSFLIIFEPSRQDSRILETVSRL